MKVRPIAIAETMFLVFVFLLVNIRSFIFWSLYPPTDTIAEPAWREIILWLLTLVLMFYLLSKYGLFEIYLQAWRRQPFLIGFVVFSLVSIFWSNNWTVTLHRSLSFAFATVAAVYLGVRYSLSDFLRVLAVLGAVILAVSYIFIFASPALGTDLNPPYNGAWRGVFWHKNQLGNILPIFTLVFMTRFFSLDPRNKTSTRINMALLYVLSLIAIFFSESVSGYIIIFLIHIGFGLSFLWLKMRDRMRPFHYYVMLIIFVVGAAVVFLNLEFVLSLINRSPTFTGRVPMWNILLRDVFPQHPWFGQGFGTTWAELSFRIRMRDLAGWLYPIMIGDNGFFDILLNLGIVGLVLFLFNYIIAWIDLVRYFLRELNLEGFFPFIFMGYTFFVNLTFSLFMETEVFVWMIIVTLMVIMVQKKNEIRVASLMN